MKTVIVKLPLWCYEVTLGILEDLVAKAKIEKDEVDIERYSLVLKEFKGGVE